MVRVRLPCLGMTYFFHICPNQPFAESKSANVKSTTNFPTKAFVSQTKREKVSPLWRDFLRAFLSKGTGYWKFIDLRTLRNRDRLFSVLIFLSYTLTEITFCGKIHPQEARPWGPQLNSRAVKCSVEIQPHATRDNPVIALAQEEKEGIDW